MAHTFYPFVENGADAAADMPSLESMVVYPARVAVYDDAAAAPRVVVVEPRDVRSYLEEITQVVTKLSHEQGGKIPFMVLFMGNEVDVPSFERFMQDTAYELYEYSGNQCLKNA